MNLNTCEELVLQKVKHPFTIFWLSNKINRTTKQTYDILTKLNKHGFITSPNYRLTKKGKTYIETFIEVTGQEGNSEKKPSEVPL